MLVVSLTDLIEYVFVSFSVDVPADKIKDILPGQGLIFV